MDTGRRNALLHQLHLGGGSVGFFPRLFRGVSAATTTNQARVEKNRVIGINVSSDKLASNPNSSSGLPPPAAIHHHESARHDAHKRNVLLAPRQNQKEKKKPPSLSHVGIDFVIPQPPSLSFPEKIIIVINKNSQEIGVTGTDTTRPRSRGTEHYIASRRRIFSPPPQKGFVLSPQLPFPLPTRSP
jgi:hypothetical protein